MIDTPAWIWALMSFTFSACMVFLSFAAFGAMAFAIWNLIALVKLRD